jgi:YbgC/YbaW family acyl-CoA thioester hydrolase
MRKTDFAGCLTATETMRVPFHDVDPANVVWHGRYFKYFEEARRTLMEELGYSYAAMMDSGFVWPVVDANVRYVRPLTLDQRFTVTAALREWGDAGTVVATREATSCQRGISGSGGHNEA